MNDHKSVVTCGKLGTGYLRCMLPVGHDGQHQDSDNGVRFGPKVEPSQEATLQEALDLMRYKACECDQRADNDCTYCLSAKAISDALAAKDARIAKALRFAREGQKCGWAQQHEVLCNIERMLELATDDTGYCGSCKSFTSAEKP